MSVAVIQLVEQAEQIGGGGGGGGGGNDGEAEGLEWW